MNSFIFGYHPRGTSMVDALASRGFEVWSVDLRDQGHTLRTSGSRRYSLDDLMLTDLPACVEHVLAHTLTSPPKHHVDMIGCSLGATIMFGYVTGVPDQRAKRLVNIGGPVRWVTSHPALRIASRSPRLIGSVPFIATRALARRVLPAMKFAPWLLSMYLHPEIVDMNHADRLVEAVENPNRHLNRQIAQWINERDLIVGGMNLSTQVAAISNDLLTIIANADGIVPRQTALWAHQNVSSNSKEVIEVGNRHRPMAHADLFISNSAPELVFSPLATWLEAPYSSNG